MLCLPVCGTMQQCSSALSVAVGRRTHMVNKDDDTDAIVMVGETGFTIQRVLD